MRPFIVGLALIGAGLIIFGLFAGKVQAASDGIATAIWVTGGGAMLAGAIVLWLIERSLLR